MAIRLYDGAWVILAGQDKPIQVRKNPHNAGLFEADGCGYDIDARPVQNNPHAPEITAILSLRDVREFGLTVGM